MRTDTPVTPAAATPGPWNVHQATYGDKYNRAVWDEPNDRQIAIVIDHGNVDANAALIAAAPELRDALAESLDTFRAIIDQCAMKDVAHLADGGKALRRECHEHIETIRNILASLTVTE